MRWLIYALLAPILFSFWGLLSKLAIFQDPLASNFLLYFSATLFSLLFLIILKRKIKFHYYPILSGISSGIANIALFYALSNNLLILVYPFVSLAAGVFFFVIYFTEKPKYTTKQKLLISFSLLLCFFGMFLLVVGFNFSNFLEQVISHLSYLFFGIIIMLGFGFWTYFLYKSSKSHIDEVNYTFWNLLAALVSAIIAIIIFKPSTLPELFSLTKLGYLYPLLSGISITIGIFFVFKSFKEINTKNKIEETIVAVLANAELIPLVILSYFVLGEWVTSGFIGILIVFLGLSLLRYSDFIK